ncbi:CoA transferase subunit A [Propylenella binzhouense]|uniref:CoA transferase subunit A n=1 Tax=Propylenella binzhouense TaxID=2555902 RepID=UPI0013699366|nr:CoA-transferase [Propylenella binzhouense]
MRVKRKSLEEALAPISSGASVAIGGSLLRRQPNAAVRNLVARGVSDLTVLSWAATTAVDFLAAAGAIRRWEGIYVGLFNHGLAPNFRRGVEEGRIVAREFSETAWVARLRAAAQGVPFLPIRGLFGSDIAVRNPDQIRTVTCPFTGDLLQAVPPAATDFTLIHGYMGDEYGNIVWPVVRDTDDVDPVFAAAATRLIVTVERIVPHELVKAQPTLTYIPGQWVESVVEVPYGSHPAACDAFYDADEAHLEAFALACRSGDGAAEYLDRYVRHRDHASYLAAVGGIEALRAFDVAKG